MGYSRSLTSNGNPCRELWELVFLKENIMEQYIITPLHSVGEIRFGMERADARKILGEFSEYKNHQQDNNTADSFDICQVFYDDDNRVEFIMFHGLDEVELRWGNKTLNNMTKDELFEFFSTLDEDLAIETDEESFESNKLGIACYFVSDIYFDEEGNEKEYDKLETISFAIANYWK